ncbi:ABC-type oligopeptide transporter ABCB9 [Ambystoma mexicanum]|uniref:ABC-type oligopeptide transporter ABCB9 n=1 Tax=Ambystoma mexicanum TaxID=8296 RepID=UPI0037E83D76
MAPWTAMSGTVLFTVADLGITTLLHADRGKSVGTIQDQADRPSLDSWLAVWGTSLLRGVLLCGALAGVTNFELCREKWFKPTMSTVSFIGSVTGACALHNLLLRPGVQEAGKEPWFWSLLAWTCVSSATTLCFCRLLFPVARSPEHQRAPSKGHREEDETSGSRRDSKREQEKPSLATVAQLLTHCKPDAALIGVASIFLVGSTLTDIFSPYYAGLVVDGIVIQKSMAHVASLMVFLSLFSLASAFSACVRVYLFSSAYTRLNLRIRHLLFNALLSQEIGFFDENQTGDIISRLTADTAKLSDVLAGNVNIFLRSAVKVLGIISIMFSLSWQLSLVTILGFPVILLVCKACGNYYKKLAEGVQNAHAKANNIAVEVLSAMKTVRSFANEEMESNLYGEKLQQVQGLCKKEAVAATFFTCTTILTQLLLQFSIVTYGAHLVISNQMSSGNLVSFLIYIFLLGDCMQDINSVHSALMQGIGAAEKVFQYLERKPLMVYDGTLTPEHLEGKVEFKHVTFAYPTRPTVQVLKDVSFTLDPGKVTALVGPSGSGKSSCVNILEHFYPLQEGEVLLDGHPISSYDHKYLRKKVSLVSQEPVLFARSIRSNILYGLESSSACPVIQAAEKANAHTFISELPDGYETEVGEKGAQLSGGQKQRVAIARALVRSPRVLILDEATSALDAESEHAIQQAVSSNLQKHTVLVVAHRLSTVEKAHHIIVLDKGCLVQQGTHKELMEKGGLYSTLVQRQVLVRDPGEEDDDVTSRQSCAVEHLPKKDVLM